jgi:hypothetical protein
VRARLATLLVAAGLLVPFAMAGASTPPAAAVAAAQVVTADDPDAAVRIVIDDLSPAIPEDGDTLRIRGRIEHSKPCITSLGMCIPRQVVVQ